MTARGSWHSLNNAGARKMLTPEGMLTLEECWYQNNADTREFLVPEKVGSGILSKS
jgi:hypothetical protein